MLGPLRSVGNLLGSRARAGRQVVAEISLTWGLEVPGTRSKTRRRGPELQHVQKCDMKKKKKCDMANTLTWGFPSFGACIQTSHRKSDTVLGSLFVILAASVGLPQPGSPLFAQGTPVHWHQPFLLLGRPQATLCSVVVTNQVPQPGRFVPIPDWALSLGSL